MSNFISGQDLLTRLNILPFELFDHVKNGLQPFDKFGKPIMPPDVKPKSERLKKIKMQLEENPRTLRLTEGKIEVTSPPGSRLMLLGDLQRRYASMNKSLQAEIETLTKELDKIENKYSWSNYELPEDKKAAQQVIDLLLRSYFNLQDVADTNTKIKKEFILGADIRSRWNIDRKQFFNIISEAVDSKKGEWILRPYNPRNYKQLTFAEGYAWPPCREVGGKIIENYSPPEHESSLDKVIEYLDQYYYLLEDVEAVEKTNPEIESESNQKEKIAPKENINEYLSKAGKKGGEKSKKNQPILLAVMKYLQDHPKLEGKANYQIAESFKRHVGKNEPIIVNFNECEWDVYFADKYIWAIADATNKKKHKDKSIAYTTFMNSYISEVKKIIKKT